MTSGGVYVSNLSSVASVVALLQMFEDAAGKIAASFFKESQTFGYVKFVEPENAQKAVDALNGKDFYGMDLKVALCSRITPGREMAGEEAPPVPPEERSSTIVIKNLPFNLPKSRLEDVLDRFDAKPVDIVFRKNEEGRFLGTAFVKYRSVKDASKVFDLVNGMEISRRVVRVEYKRKQKKLADMDPPDEQTKEMFDAFERFLKDEDQVELAMPPNLTNFQRNALKAKCIKHQLYSRWKGSRNDEYFVISKVKFDFGSGDRKYSPLNSRGRRSDMANGGQANNDGDSPASFSSPIAFRSRANRTGANTREEENVYVPKRQPKRPDGTRGFASRQPQQPQQEEGEDAKDAKDTKDAEKVTDERNTKGEDVDKPKADAVENEKGNKADMATEDGEEKENRPNGKPTEEDKSAMNAATVTKTMDDRVENDGEKTKDVST